ncbi:signal peptidase II [Paenibacillus beijingensis]|uniref:Lipoprotein signal peptidase n=1 Tax=Paenibacillus beijingensis TaxID=1126833 RepID=A0A0D5NSH9_9BACL|nr:signal peptidase II [Paenibacillus beijingensis]AJY77863.1 signal peptidase II [Paenibacillus beijingensis]
MKLYAYWIAIIVFVLDFITKKIVANNMTIGEQIPVIGNFFVLTSIRNTGAAFSIFEGARYFFLFITLIVVAGIVWYIRRARESGSLLLITALGMVLGGAVGNFLDRAIYGEVVDFLQLNFGSYTFPIFNVADIGITVGVALIVLDSLLSGNDKAEKLGQTDHEIEDNKIV